MKTMKLYLCYAIYCALYMMIFCKLYLLVFSKKICDLITTLLTPGLILGIKL